MRKCEHQSESSLSPFPGEPRRTRPHPPRPPGHPPPSYLLEDLLGGAKEYLTLELNAQYLVPVRLKQAAMRCRPHRSASLVHPLQRVPFSFQRPTHIARKTDAILSVQEAGDTIDTKGVTLAIAVIKYSSSRSSTNLITLSSMPCTR